MVASLHMNQRYHPSHKADMLGSLGAIVNRYCHALSIIAIVALVGLGEGNAQTASPQQACALHRLVTLDMTPAADRTVRVPVMIKGKLLHFRLNAFGPGSISEAAAKSLQLQPTIQSMDIPEHETDFVPLLSLMGQTQRVDVSAVTLPVIDATGADGTLGGDILRSFDLEFDFSSNQLNLFSEDHCPGKVVYWADSYGEILLLPSLTYIQHTNAGHSVEAHSNDRFNATLDGVEFTTAFNTSLVHTRLPMILALGYFSIGTMNDLYSTSGLSCGSEKCKFDPSPPVLPTGIVTIDPNPPRGAVEYRYKFSNLTFSGVSLHNILIDLWNDGLPRPAHNSAEIQPERLELGLDVMRSLHLYVANKEQKIYFTSADAHK